MQKPSNPPGTRVALYLRRSKDTQEESLETQRRGARAYCAARGWTTVAEYVDDAISRAEFKRRPSLIRLLNHAKDRAFDLVVMRDESRLGGDTYRTGLVIQDLADVNVGIVHYISDELVIIDNAVDKFLVSARNFASELEREKISSRTHEHLMQKAKAGKAAGGISYGYGIANQFYVVNESQAAIVRRIFDEYAGGAGMRSIAQQLNHDGIASPRGGIWLPSALRALLKNPRYIGKGRYNQTRKVYRGGTAVREPRPEQERFTYACPPIVTHGVWDAVAKRFASNPVFGSAPGTRGARPAYLLTGISKCAECGGYITVTNRSKSPAYVCGWRHDKGKALCSNTARHPMAELDARVLAAVQAKLTAAVVSRVIHRVRAIIAQRQSVAPAATKTIRAEVQKLQREIDRLTAALATSDAPPASVVRAIAERDQRLRQAESRLAASVDATPVTMLDALEFDARQRLANLSASDPAAQHDLLAKLLHGERLRCIPQRGRFRVEFSVSAAGLMLQECDKSRSRFATVRTVLEGIRIPLVA